MNCPYWTGDANKKRRMQPHSPFSFKIYLKTYLNYHSLEQQESKHPFDAMHAQKQFVLRSFY